MIGYKWTGWPAFHRPSKKEKIANILRSNLFDSVNLHRITVEFCRLSVTPDSVLGIAANIFWILAEPPEKMENLHNKIATINSCNFYQSRCPDLNRRPLPSRIPVLLLHSDRVRLYIEHIRKSDLAPLVSRSGVRLTPRSEPCAWPLTVIRVSPYSFPYSGQEIFSISPWKCSTNWATTAYLILILLDSRRPV